MHTSTSGMISPKIRNALAIRKELKLAVKRGYLTHKEAEAIGKRCYSRKG